MKRVVFLVLLLGFVVPGAWGQDAPRTQQAKSLSVLPDLTSNDVQVLAPAGDSLWIGGTPTLYLEPNDRPDSDSLRVIDRLSLREGEQLAASIAAQNEPSRQRVWIGLAFDTGGGELGADGFLVSSDGGDSFTERGPRSQLDEPADTAISYGNDVLTAEPVRQQAGSVPQDLAFGPGPDTVWVAGRRSGLRWTTDGGDNWSRAVLPPDTASTVDPTTPTEGLVSPRLDNYNAYSVLVDETGTVWAGTLGGLNRSRPADVKTVQGTRYRAWDRFAGSTAGGGPPGSFVVALAEEPRSGARNPIWIAALSRGFQSDERSGVAVTTDGGQTFRQTLLGEQIVDIAARANAVYAVGADGLFVSTNGGRSWQSVERFPLQNDDKELPSDVAPQSVAVTAQALWVGTSDGLLRLDRADEDDLLGGRPAWQLLRAETPVNPEPGEDDAPDVSTYAYPNPFVPSRHKLVRIAYEVDRAGPVTVTIYDFSMNRVRTLTERKSTGQQETVWRGTNDQGLRVPTGTYFYEVELGDQTVNGKILLAN